MVAALHAALGRILEEGLHAVHARHAEAGRLLHEGLAELGLELFAAEGHRLPELTTGKVPDGVDSAAVRKELLERYDLEIGAGAGACATSVSRIGLSRTGRVGRRSRVLGLAEVPRRPARGCRPAR